MITPLKSIRPSVAAAVLVLLGACSSPHPSGNSGADSAATGGPVSAQATSLGTILVDEHGRTVYEFANDKSNESTCYDACAANWPPVLAPSQLSESAQGVDGALDSTTRRDGTRQLTVAGHPVYTFAGDTAAGQANGQGIILDGGQWTVVLPSGAPGTDVTDGSASTPGY
jgi:predicted lipoprotein with Yx(FWY)xxD motif